MGPNLDGIKQETRNIHVPRRQGKSYRITNITEDWSPIRSHARRDADPHSHTAGSHESAHCIVWSMTHSLEAEAVTVGIFMQLRYDRIRI